MITPVLHRKLARGYLTRAEHARSRARRCRYLRLAISNTICARELEALEEEPSDEVNEEVANERPPPRN
jgi:hypothetical protein